LTRIRASSDRLGQNRILGNGVATARQSQPTRWRERRLAFRNALSGHERLRLAASFLCFPGPTRRQSAMVSSLMPRRKEFFDLLATRSERVAAGANATLRLANGLGQDCEDILALVAEVP